MLPKVSITYSDIYDMVLHEYHRRSYNHKNYEKMITYTKRVQNVWDSVSEKSLRAIAKVSGLKWKKSEIRCYVVKHVLHPFSDPLTLKITENMNYAKETLMHELVHQILIQNWGNVRIKKLSSKYKNENWNTILHILVSAILDLVFRKSLSNDKIIKYIAYDKGPTSKFSNDYRRSWDIVRAEGAKKIISQYIKKAE